MQIFFNYYNTNSISFNKYQKSAKVLAKEKELDDKIINLFKSGLERKQISAELGICLTRVGKALNKFNLLKERKDNLVKQITEMLFAGYGYKEIANKLNISEGTVYKLTKKDNILKQAKENRNQEIFELRMERNLSIKEIADILKVSDGTVKKVLYTYGIKKFTRTKSGV